MDINSDDTLRHGKKCFGFSSATLHVLGMLFMLMDHSWATVLSQYDILTCIGRLAFPIFAFMTVEGFYHTSNINKYIKRMVIYGLISEIPFNYMVAGGLFYPFHQNVMWTFFWGLLMMKTLSNLKPAVFPVLLLKNVGTILLFCLLASVTFTDYNGAGILMIATFYFLRQEKWPRVSAWVIYLGQIICMYYINFELLKGLVYPISIGAFSFDFPHQGFAILALPFIWLYNGEKGYSGKWFKQFCYWFYPVHMLVLYALFQILI